MNVFVVYFYSSSLTNDSVYKEFQALFSTYGDIVKLYINYDQHYGKVYFKDLDSANDAYESLSQADTNFLTVESPQPHLFKKFISLNSSKMDEVEATAGNTMYDYFGNSVETLVSDLDNETYVPLSFIRKMGYELYSQKPTARKATEKEHEDLKEYLRTQAMVYIKMQKLIFNSSTVSAAIENTCMPVMQNKSTTNQATKPQKFIVTMNGSPSSLSKISATSNDSIDKKVYEYLKLDLALNTTYEVEVMIKLKNGKYYVRLLSSQNIYDAISYDTILEANKGIVAEPKEKCIYAGLYNKTWYRVYVHTLDPMLLVYIDIGYWANIKKGDEPELRVLPVELCRRPGLAIRVKLNSNAGISELENHQRVSLTLDKKYEDGTYLATCEKITTAPSIERKPSTSNYHHQSNGQNDIDRSDNTSRSNSRNSFKSDSSVPINGPDTKNVSANYSNSRNMPKETSSQITSPKNMSYPNTPKQDIAKNTFIGGKQNGELKIAESSSTDSKSDASTSASTIISNTTNPGKKIKRRNIIEFLNGTTGFIQYIETLSDESFIAFIFPETSGDDIGLLDTIPDNINENLAISAEVGDTVAVKSLVNPDEPETWVRGLVLAVGKNKYTVALIDHGSKITTSKICKLPEQFMMIHEFLVICTGDKKSSCTMEKLQAGGYEGKKNNVISISQENICFDVTCKPMIFEFEAPIASQKIITSLPAVVKDVELNEMVMITNEEDGVFYLRTRKYLMCFKLMISDLNAYQEIKLDKPPTINQLVLHKCDGEKRRSQIKSINDNMTVTVAHIDYGQTTIASINDLYYIDKYHTVEGTLSNKKLKGFETAPFCPEAKIYISRCLKKTKFTVASLNNDVVELSCADGNLSDILKNFERPNYRTLGDLPPVELPIGSTLNLMLLEFTDIKDGSLVVMRCDPAVTTQFCALSERLIEEANSMPTSTELHKDEICVAYFQGEWYRALVEEARPSSNEYSVFFIDFGNKSTVSLNETKIISENMLHLEPMAIKAQLKDILDKYGGKIPESVCSQLDLDNKIYEVHIISKVDSIYNISIPSIWNQQ